MENGADSEEFVLLSGPRIGLKREFAFALKGQSEFFGSVGGRTRARKAQKSTSDHKSSATATASASKDDESCRNGFLVIKSDSDEEEPPKRSPPPPTESPTVEDNKGGLLLKSLTGEEEEEEEEEETNNCGLLSSPPKAEEPKKEFLEEDGIGGETPVVIDETSESRDGFVEKPMKFYVRSVLRRKIEPMEISASATTSSSSILSGDVNCKNEESAEGEEKSTDVASPLRTPSNNSTLEMTMSKKIAFTKFPSKVKELLDTGLLEGLPVHYFFRNNKKEGLMGTVKDSGILCSCNLCDGCQVISPFQFEKHAGSANKRAAEYIYLENGMSLRHVMNACKDVSPDELEATIKSVICPSPVGKFTICQNCKGPLPPSCLMKRAVFCTSCLTTKICRARPSNMPRANFRSSKLSESALKCVSTLSKSNQGKITRKDLRLHKLPFEKGGLPDGTELGYYIHGQKLIEGYKKGLGIFCRCCNTEVSPSQFESHAGWASRRKPYLNIYTSNGVSLHELSVSLSRGQRLTANDNDDLCSICADFGELLLCDSCPRAFHQDCVGLPNVPRGNWYCPYCQLMYEREKFCAYNANAKAAGRVPGVDPIAEITERCTRIVKSPDTEVGGCVLCRSHSFCKLGFGPRTVLLCDQCEKEYHVGCLKEHKMANLRELPEGEWFCCTDCSRIHSVLHKLLVSGSQKLPDSLSNIIKQKYVEEGSNDDAGLDIRWSLLSGKTASSESRLLLSKAVAIFHDRFDPIIDSSTGRDLIPLMVYGRNIRDQDFGGMYCAVLTVNSSVVSAGILRVFGVEIAELPLVATTTEKQGKGYFQTLFSCIEQLLGSLHVQNLVLPAAEEAESIWTNRFGFTKMTHEEVNAYRKDCQMMYFEGTPMLQKPIPDVGLLEV